MSRAASKQVRAPRTTDASHRINTVTNLLHTLMWVAKKCESDLDFEQFHTLTFDLIPVMGESLEAAVKDLGEIYTGLFEKEGLNHG